MTAVLKVLLLLLKWIGILLLVILGLLLVTVLLVLLAPIRYKGRLDKKEAPEEIFRADGLISWLNPFLRIRIRYTEKKLHYSVRIFGIGLLNSDKPKKEKKRKKKEKTKKEKTKKEEKRKQTAEEGTTEKPTAEEVSEQKVAADANAATKGQGIATVSENDGEALKEEAGQEAAPDNQEDSEAEKKPSLFSKIKSLFERIKSIPEKIKQKVTKIIITVKLLWHKKEKTMAFFEDELHRTALGTAWDITKQMLRHILPGKIKGHVEFGTGEPDSTGKALGALGVLYAWYGKGITVVPDFYEKRIVAELEFKGRIRCGTVLVKGLRLIRDKKVKRLIRNFKKLLVILKQKAE